MRKMLVAAAACFCAAALLCLPAGAAEEEEAKKYKTKEVMKEAFKGPLLKKVAGGEASDEDKKKLHDMLVAMSKNEAPKGDAESWKKLTSALVKASKAAVDGDEGAGDMLKKAANCKACHSAHKP
ncbi:hypothetical protein [Stieleria varia]|uniref:Cytochrome C n=1 Tax=Stieleria varia TaxID=2528005 RepID=A0A5C6B331_9BACT|nr:hypothetical protein [Stieleria varia]TWU05769.1 hypothetical protein Pla52n_14840 [Stieleria varia]